VTPRPLYLLRKPRFSYYVGGWLDPRVGLKVLRRAKSLASAGIRSPDRAARSIFIILTTLGLLIEALWYFYGQTNIDMRYYIEFLYDNYQILIFPTFMVTTAHSVLSSVAT
jgi:hypothetical protein